jgi:hypothetical protein
VGYELPEKPRLSPDTATIAETDSVTDWIDQEADYELD